LLKKTLRTGTRVPVNHTFKHDHALFSLTPEEHEPPVHVYRGSQVSACLENQKAFHDEGSFVDGISTAPGRKKLSGRMKGELERIDGRVLDLVTPGSNLYSHWLLDLLPKIKILTEAGYDVANDFDRIIVNFYGSAFKRESFRLLGIDESKVWDYRTHSKYFIADELVTVTAPRTRLYTPTWVADFVNDLFSQGDAQGMPSKVYISRSKGNTRRILNEAAFIEKISALGYKTYYCEDHSVATTAAVMRNATHVIAPHGAGLANIIFSRPGTQVLELYCAHLSPEFYKMSLARGLDYRAMQILGDKSQIVDVANMDYANDREYYHSMNMVIDCEFDISGL